MKYQLIAAAFVGSVLVSCTPYQQQGAAVGGIAGGALGAVAGGDGRATLKGAALGAGIGAGIAAMRENQQSQYNRGSGYSDPGAMQHHSPPPQQQMDDYPYAERTSTPGEVLSPYAPYNVIDVRGFASGSKAKDPSCGKIFRVP